MQIVLSLKSEGESRSIFMSVIALLQNYQLWKLHQQSQCKETWMYKYMHSKHPYCGSGIPGNARIKVFMTFSFSSPGCVSGHRKKTVTAWFLCIFPGHRRPPCAAARGSSLSSWSSMPLPRTVHKLFSF